MADIVEFWILNEYVHLLPQPVKGRNTGSCTIIQVPREGPKFEKIRELTQWLKAEHDKSLFFSWEVIRKYTEEEWAAAKLCYWDGTKLFEPSGEECGTIYDETQACDICGANAPMVGPLRLHTRTIPRKYDLSGTVGEELVFSARFKAACEAYQLKGIQFEQIHNRQDQPIDFFQIKPVARPLTITDRTITGIGLFNRAGHECNEVYKCPKGGNHNIGLNRTSELYVKNSPEIAQYDLFETRQKIGTKRGMIRPMPQYLCSPAFRNMVLCENLKGFIFEIAHVE